MNNIPPKLRKELSVDPFYSVCSIAPLHVCGGRITWEHALTFGGSQIQRRFAIVPVCAKGHAVNEYQDSGELRKELMVWVALNRATDEEIDAISKAINYHHTKKYLNGKYGIFVEPALPALSEINY